MRRHTIHLETVHLFKRIDFRLIGRMVFARAPHPIAKIGHVVRGTLHTVVCCLMILIRTMTRRVKPRVKRSPDRHTHSHGGIVVGEHHPFTGQSVDIRRRDIGTTVAADFICAQVIGYNNHDVGLSSFCLHDNRHHRKRREQYRKKFFCLHIHIGY